MSIPAPAGVCAQDSAPTQATLFLVGSTIYPQLQVYADYHLSVYFRPVLQKTHISIFFQGERKDGNVGRQLQIFKSSVFRL